MIRRSTHRNATRQTCPKCGAQVLVGPDHDVAALVVTVDPAPITSDREVALIDAGVPTYTARSAREGVQLWYRDAHFRPPSHHLPVYATHACPHTVQELPL